MNLRRNTKDFVLTYEYIRIFSPASFGNARKQPKEDRVPKEIEAPRPTNGELAILAVLWQAGPSTVREVLDGLKDRDVGYTTVLKLLQIMTDKGLVQRDESARSHIYRATRPAEDVKRGLVSDLLDRAFDGSAANLVMHALQSQKASAAELREIRNLLDSLAVKGKGK
jgi:BlaI family penicillinase repressor